MLIGCRLNKAQAPNFEMAYSRHAHVLVENTDVQSVKSELMEQLGISSALVLPLIAGDQVSGVLKFGCHDPDRAISLAGVDFAHKLAVMISLALNNASLYTRKRKIADVLQKTMLDMPEEIDGLAFDCLYKSATEEARVGGDFYDLFEVEPGRIAILIGDVSGKGIEAAGLASLIKHTARAYAFDGHPPGQIVTKMDLIVGKASGSSTFATIFFGIIDRNKGELVYCNAGHPPPFRFSGPRDISTLDVTSPAIGAWDGFVFKEDRVEFSVEETLLLITDGIIEARHNNVFYGEDRLHRLLQTRADGAAANLPQAVFEDVLEYADGVLSDDIAMLAVTCV